MKTLVDNPKPPFQLFHKRDGELKEANIWACGECNTLVSGQGYDRALECCKTKFCSCGKRRDPDYLTSCSDCRDRQTREKYAALKEVEYNGGPVVEFDGDRYHDDMDTFLEWCDDQESDDEDFERPDFIHHCDENQWKGLRPEHWIESALDDLYEDADDSVFTGLDELYKFVSEWNKKQNIPLWEIRPGEKVRVPGKTTESVVSLDTPATDDTLLNNLHDT